MTVSDVGLLVPEDSPQVVNVKQDFDPIDRMCWAAGRFSVRFNGSKEFEPGGYLTDYYTDEAIKVIEAANTGIEGIYDLLDQMKSLASAAKTSSNTSDLANQFDAIRDQIADMAEDSGYGGQNLLDGAAPFVGAYRTSDDRHVFVSPLEPKFFAVMLERMGIDDLDAARHYDPKYWPVILQRLEQVFAGRTRAEWGEEHAAQLAFFDSKRLAACLDVSLSRVTDTLKAAESKLQLHRRALVRGARDVSEPLGMIARSKTMQHVVDLARRVAAVDATVLITGESGTGKELAAAAIHAESHRAGGPFVPVNCGALPENILESELFGHVRGAFTGAVRDRVGRFELAAGGTGVPTPPFEITVAAHCPDPDLLLGHVTVNADFGQSITYIVEPKRLDDCGYQLHVSPREVVDFVSGPQDPTELQCQFTTRRAISGTMGRSYWNIEPSDGGKPQ